MRRNADEDLRELERIATETRAQADIVRYESAATRVGIRRLVSVNDLVEPRRIPKTEGGIYLGHPTQVARVIEVEVLRPRTDPGEPGLSGLGFGASGLGLTFFVESRAPWAGAPRGEDPAFVFDGLWGRAVDPPRFHHWPVPFGRDRGRWPTQVRPWSGGAWATRVDCQDRHGPGLDPRRLAQTPRHPCLRVDAAPAVGVRGSEGPPHVDRNGSHDRVPHRRSGGRPEETPQLRRRQGRGRH